MLKKTGQLIELFSRAQFLRPRLLGDKFPEKKIFFRK
jgi:hypothetical protein